MHYKRFSYFRLYLTGIVLLLGFVGVIYRHAYLAVENQSFLLEKSHARTERKLHFSANKGQMVDRYGHPLAVSLPYYRFAINPQKYVYTDEDIAVLAPILNQSATVLNEKIRQHHHSKYLKLADRLNEEQVKQLSQLSWEGLMFEERRGRFYPLGEAASSVIGYVDVDGKGQIGMEYQFDEYIDGRDGQMTYTQNLLNQVTHIHHYDPPHSGNQLQLTLDHRLQHFTYEILKEAVEYHDAQYASAVILSSKTGEILAMVNYPSFDPNEPIRIIDEKTKNHVITDLFEPGSIIKPIALAGVLQHSSHDLSERMDVSGGQYRYRGWVFHDHKDLETMLFEDILLKSSNIAMVKLTAALKPGDLIKNYQSFGLFSPLFVQLPGEAIGRHVSHAGPVDEAAMSYGYGLSVNLLGIARAYNILANDGYDPGVHLVFERHRPAAEDIFSADIAKTIKHMMVRVTEKGVASRKAKVGHIKVAGKSGTSHLLGKDGKYENAYVATFVGFAPSEDTEIVAAVMVYRPKKHGHYGGQVAAPIFAKLLANALNYLPK